jgi:hypothetical protein
MDLSPTSAYQIMAVPLPPPVCLVLYGVVFLAELLGGTLSCGVNLKTLQ